MKKWYPLQKRLVGGNMDALFLTMGGILIPLGFYLKIEASISEPSPTIAVILGLISWLLAYWWVIRREKRDKLERRALVGLLDQINKELKGLREDVRDTKKRKTTKYNKPF